MSLDKSLKSKGELARHRNVLTRAERIEVLQDEERWDEEEGVFGLPKVAHRKVVTKKHAKEIEGEGVPAAEGEAEAGAPEAGEAEEETAP